MRMPPVNHSKLEPERTLAVLRSQQVLRDFEWAPFAALLAPPQITKAKRAVPPLSAADAS